MPNSKFPTHPQYEGDHQIMNLLNIGSSWCQFHYASQLRAFCKCPTAPDMRWVWHRNDAAALCKTCATNLQHFGGISCTYQSLIQWFVQMFVVPGQIVWTNIIRTNKIQPQNPGKTQKLKHWILVLVGNTKSSSSKACKTFIPKTLNPVHPHPRKHHNCIIKACKTFIPKSLNPES